MTKQELMDVVKALEKEVALLRKSANVQEEIEVGDIVSQFEDESLPDVVCYDGDKEVYFALAIADFEVCSDEYDTIEDLIRSNGYHKLEGAELILKGAEIIWGIK